jgi:hypothetical protein
VGLAVREKEHLDFGQGCGLQMVEMSYGLEEEEEGHV